MVCKQTLRGVYHNYIIITNLNLSHMRVWVHVHRYSIIRMVCVGGGMNMLHDLFISPCRTYHFQEVIV